MKILKKKLFEITGKYNQKNTQFPFTRTVEAFNEKHAIETVLSLFGSEHKTKRRNIEINEVKPASSESKNEKPITEKIEEKIQKPVKTQKKDEKEEKKAEKESKE